MYATTVIFAEKENTGGHMITNIIVLTEGTQERESDSLSLPTSHSVSATSAPKHAVELLQSQYSSKPWRRISYISDKCHIHERKMRKGGEDMLIVKLA